MLLSIIIPTFNRHESLLKCLGLVEKQTVPSNKFEVIIVNDGGSKISETLISCFQFKIIIINQRNNGPASARNAGAKLASGKFLVFLDDDCMPQPNWLNSFTEQLKNKQNSILGGKVICDNDSNAFVIANQLITDIVYEYYNREDKTNEPFFSACNMLVPASIFLKLGGFNTGFRTAEDREFCDRCVLHNYHMQYLPKAIVCHEDYINNIGEFCRRYFKYGIGAFKFHNIRARRNSGSFLTSIKLHTNISSWFFYPFKRGKTASATLYVLLLLVWQLSNITGFLFENLMSRFRRKTEKTIYMPMSRQSRSLPRLLIIAPYCIHPADTGGKIRTFEIAKGLAKQGMETTVLMPMTPACFRRCQLTDHLTLEIVPYPFALPYLLSGRPFSYMYLLSFHPGYQLLVKRWLQAFDIIQFEGVSFGGLIDAIPKGKIVIYDAQNVEVDYLISETSATSVQRIEMRRIKSLEAKIAKRADRILACSDHDSKRMASLYNVSQTRIPIVPNGINLRQEHARFNNGLEKFPGIMKYPCRAIFSGSNVAHNRAAVRFLIDTVVPITADQCAFIIQGQCGKSFMHLKYRNVFFDTQPGNVGTYKNICTVALNPITQGSGTSLKVLDYLSHGLPVVSTEFGMRGYDDLKKYVVIVEPTGFADALFCEHKFDQNIYQKLEKYTWTRISQELFSEYQLLVKR